MVGTYYWSVYVRKAYVYYVRHRAWNSRSRRSSAMAVGVNCQLPVGTIPYCQPLRSGFQRCKPIISIFRQEVRFLSCLVYTLTTELL